MPQPEIVGSRSGGYAARTGARSSSPLVAHPERNGPAPSTHDPDDRHHCNIQMEPDDRMKPSLAPRAVTTTRAPVGTCAPTVAPRWRVGPRQRPSLGPVTLAEARTRRWPPDVWIEEVSTALIGAGRRTVRRRLPVRPRSDANRVPLAELLRPSLHKPVGSTPPGRAHGSDQPGDISRAVRRRANTSALLF